MGQKQFLVSAIQFKAPKDINSLITQENLSRLAGKKYLDKIPFKNTFPITKLSHCFYK